MFKVLLATDGSGFSLRAADYVANMFRHRADLEVIVLYVEEVNSMLLSPTSAASMPQMPILPDQVTEALSTIQEHMEKERTTILASTMERFASLGKRATSRSQMGKPADIICEIADQENVDLVVVGSSGKGVMKRALLGSVSYKVVHQAKVPVLIVREKD